MQEEPLAGAPESGDAAAAEGAHAGGLLRLLAAVVTAPWLVGDGIIGAWAVTRGVSAAAGGHPSIDVGYARAVTPTGVIVVGALLLAGFAVLLAVAMLILYDSRGRGAWATAGVIAAVLTAGSVWAAVSGGLNPGLWLLFFGGLLYAVVLSLTRLILETRAARRGTIAEP